MADVTFPGAPIRAAIGRYPHTAPLFQPGTAVAGRRLELAEMPVISRAFAPMVRELRWDVSEMAIATFLMARAAGVPLVLLPVTMAARFQEGALLTRKDGGVAGPAALAGKRVGVRAYSQTTGMWLRGVLAEAHGVAPEAVRWVTFEDAHVAGYADPPWAGRAAPGADMLAMLKAGELDAAVFGNELPADPTLRPVFADVGAAARAFHAAHGCVPVNHLVVATSAFAQAEPAALAALSARLREGAEAAGLACGRAALRPALALAGRWCAAQGLTPAVLTPEDAFAGLPATIG